MIEVFSQYVSPKRIVLIGGEALLIALSIYCAAAMRFWSDISSLQAYIEFPYFALPLVAMVLTFQVCFYYNDLYDLNTPRSYQDRIVDIGRSIGSACCVLGLLYFLIPGLIVGRGVLFIAVGLIGVAAMATRSVLERVWPAADTGQNILILGCGPMAVAVAREFRNRSDLNVHIVALMGQEAGATQETELGYPVAGPIGDIEAFASSENVSRIVVALENRRGMLPVRSLVRLRVSGVRVEDAHTALAALSGRIWLETVQPSWFVFSDGFHRSRLMLEVKRTVDLAFGLLGLIVSFPVMALVALAVKLDSPGPVLYRQTRVGYRGRQFQVLKFRSMRTDAEAANGAQWASVCDSRVTRVGRFIRQFRLDELPQFVNVIRGEMSFVGPRPERPVFVEELNKVIPYYDERHSVRPGLTGWAQIQYPYGASVEDSRRKLEYDLFYLKNMSLLFDLAIVFDTVRIVLGAKGSR